MQTNQCAGFVNLVFKSTRFLETNMKIIEKVSSQSYLHELLADAPESLRLQAAKDEGICQIMSNYVKTIKWSCCNNP
jgi:hypothetical protein